MENGKSHCFSSYKNCDELDLAKEKRGYYLHYLFCPKEIFYLMNTLSEYTYFYILKNFTSYTSVTCFLNRRKPLAYP